MEMIYNIPATLKVKVDGEETEVITNMVGSIKLKIPTQPERMTILKAVNYSNKDGEIVEASTFEKAEVLYSKVKEFVKEVSIKTEFEGNQIDIKSIDDLTCFEEGTHVVNTLYSVLTKGARLGKN